MPRTKSHSTELAHIIDQAKEQLEALIIFADNITTTIETARKYEEIRPLINRLKVLDVSSTTPELPAENTPVTSPETQEATKRVRRIKKAVENDQTLESNSDSKE